MDEDYNAFGDFQNNDDDSDKDKYGNSGDDRIFVDNLVWEDIYGDITIPDLPYHYCSTHGLKKGL